nr:MAG TPA: hypothetical protein [Caudoviricetes sp.]
MSLFRNNVKGSLENQTEEVLKECEKVMDVAYKASGLSIMDAMNGLDAESGAMLGAVMALYGKTKNLALTQAKAMDKMQNSFDELKEMNKKLLKQNEQMQHTLRNMGSQNKAEKK